MSNKYPIKTFVANLFDTDNNKCIFHNDNYYKIPIYQRPYSWNEEHIANFLDSILDDFIKENDKGKAIFFGTMQFNVKNNDKDIVDGQQRMTTFIMFLTLLKYIASINNDNLPIQIDSDIINSFIKNENGICDRLLSLKPKKKKGAYILEEITNKYEQNYLLLYLLFKDYFNDKKEELKEHDVEDLEGFAKAVYYNTINNVYFVVMETEKENMPLSEIVSVFNTINTTGMDLNAADIFKLKFFDYHKNPQATTEEDDKLMSEIDDCFKYHKNNTPQLEMSDVLTIYKHILCSAPKDNSLGFANLKKSNEAFFEWLFKNNKLSEELHEHLKVETLNKLVRLVSMFYTYSYNNSNNNIYSLGGLITYQTRYSRYWTLPYVYIYFKLSDRNIELIDKCELESIFNDALKVVYNAGRIFIIYSVVYDKVINYIQNEMCNKYMPSFKDETIYQLKPEDETYNTFRERLKKDLKANDLRAYIVCLFSAIIDELNFETNIIEIRKKLFDRSSNPFDIEHIEAKNNWNGLSDDEEQLFNGIGNLVVLERRINRDIKDKPINEKIKYYRGTVKGKDKEKSHFISVDKVCELFKNSNEKWDKEEIKKVIEERGNNEISKITKILFESN